MANSEKKIKTPLRPQEVTQEWLLGTLQVSLACQDVKVLQLAPVEKNEGYLSGAFKAKVKIGDKEEPLFIKIGLPSDNPFSMFVTMFNADATEIRAYNEELPTLAKFEEEHTGKSVIANMIPKVYAAGMHLEGDERGHFMIMEDLSLNYQTIKMEDGMSLEKLKLCLGRIARMHATSYCYNTINKKTFPKERRFPFDKHLDMVDAWSAGFAQAIEDLKQRDGAQEVCAKLEKLSKNYKESCTKALEFDERFLIHGDFWSNNVMFNNDITQVKIFDFQFLSSASPYVDFIFMAFYSASPENMEKWLDDMYDAYYGSLVSTCKEFNIEAPFTKEKFVSDCQSKGFFLMFTLLTSLFEVVKDRKTQDRLIWNGKKALKYSPELFNV